jgi:phosphonate transport system substrate-binding protein
MTMPVRLRALLACLLLLFVVLAPRQALCAQQGSPQAPLRFSLIPKKDIDQQINEVQPLLQLLEERLQRPIEIVRPHSYRAVIEGLLSHSIDLAILGPASYAYARARDENIDAFASFSQKEGFSTPRGSYYQSLLIVHKRLGIRTAQKLRGKKVAFTDPASTSGSLIPRVEFSSEIHRSIRDFFGATIYTGSHDRSIEAVMAGNADAAFVSSARLDEAVRKAVVPPRDVLILWRSRPIHRDPFVFGGSLDEGPRQDIRTVMLSAAPFLQDMFARLGVEDIVPVSDRDYQPIHDIAARQQGPGR